MMNFKVKLEALKCIHLLMGTLLFFESCYSNMFLIDGDKNAIYSDNYHRIYSLEISEENGTDCYQIVWLSTSKRPPKYIYLDSVDLGYSISPCLELEGEKEINPINFKLKPNTIYVLSRREIGDASGVSYSVKTNEYGKFQ